MIRQLSSSGNKDSGRLADDLIAKAELLSAIKERIGNRIRQIHVEVLDNNVSVRGIVNSFFASQLVNAACSRFRHSHSRYQLDCAIQVHYDTE